MNETSWHVMNNVTGERISRDYDAEDKATGVCAALNMQAYHAGMGGLYGVEEITRNETGVIRRRRV